MADPQAIRDQVQRHWDALRSNDHEAAHSVYHDDAVLEFPQSGERFEGLDNFKAWRAGYPATVVYTVKRITVDGQLAVVEIALSYDDGPSRLGVQLLEFRGDRIARERIYVTEPWDAAEWRTPWRSARPAE